jgi:hypothetical protein
LICHPFQTTTVAADRCATTAVAISRNRPVLTRRAAHQQLSPRQPDSRQRRDENVPRIVLAAVAAYAVPIIAFFTLPGTRRLCDRDWSCLAAVGNQYPVRASQFLVRCMQRGLCITRAITNSLTAGTVGSVHVVRCYLIPVTLPGSPPRCSTRTITVPKSSCIVNVWPHHQ